MNIFNRLAKFYTVGSIGFQQRIGNTYSYLFVYANYHGLDLKDRGNFNLGRDIAYRNILIEAHLNFIHPNVEHGIFGGNSNQFGWRYVFFAAGWCGYIGTT